MDSWVKRVRLKRAGLQLQSTTSTHKLQGCLGELHQQRWSQHDEITADAHQMTLKADQQIITSASKQTINLTHFAGTSLKMDSFQLVGLNKYCLFRHDFNSRACDCDEGQPTSLLGRAITPAPYLNRLV